VAIDDADNILPEHIPGVIGTLACQAFDIRHCDQEAEYLPVQETVGLWADLDQQRRCPGVVPLLADKLPRALQRRSSSKVSRVLSDTASLLAEAYSGTVNRIGIPSSGSKALHSCCHSGAGFLLRRNNSVKPPDDQP